MVRLEKTGAVFLAVLLLAGCAGDEDKKVLTGERISALEFQRELEPDPVLAVSHMSLPEAWNNQFWPQAGGYPSHTMGHLVLGDTLSKAWEISIGAGGDRDAPLISRPVVADGLVFTLDVKQRLSAFDVKTGREKWSVSLVPPKEKKHEMPGGGLAYAGGRIYVTTTYQRLLAVDPANGKTLWETILPSLSRSAPAVASDRIFVTTFDNRLLCHSTQTGEPIWNYTGLAETTNVLGSSSPAVDQSVAVAAFSSGELGAFRVENGQSLWSDNLSAVRKTGPLASIADIRGLPVIDQGLVFAISFSGRLVAIDLKTGDRIWQREIGGGETPYAVGDTVFLITSDQQLLAVSRTNGSIRWVSPLPSYEDPDQRKSPIVWTGPVLAGGRLIIASNAGEVMEMSPADGKKIRAWETEGPVTIPPIVADATLFILSGDGHLTAYR